jgi:hypothetical protein
MSGVVSSVLLGPSSRARRRVAAADYATRAQRRLEHFDARAALFQAERRRESRDATPIQCVDVRGHGVVCDAASWKRVFDDHGDAGADLDRRRESFEVSALRHRLARSGNARADDDLGEIRQRHVRRHRHRVVERERGREVTVFLRIMTASSALRGAREGERHRQATLSQRRGRSFTVPATMRRRAAAPPVAVVEPFAAGAAKRQVAGVAPVERAFS